MKNAMNGLFVAAFVATLTACGAQPSIKGRDAQQHEFLPKSTNSGNSTLISPGETIVLEEGLEYFVPKGARIFTPSHRQFDIDSESIEINPPPGSIVTVFQGNRNPASNILKPIRSGLVTSESGRWSAARVAGGNKLDFNEAGFYSDGKGTNAKIYGYGHLAYSPGTNEILFSDAGAFRKMDMLGTVTTLAFKPNDVNFDSLAVDNLGNVSALGYRLGSKNGIWSICFSQFNLKSTGIHLKSACKATAGSFQNSLMGGLAVLPTGDLVSVGSAQNILVRVERNGIFSVYSGTGNTTLHDSDNLSEAAYSNPVDIASSIVGRVLVADKGNHSVRLIDSLGTVSTVTKAIFAPSAVAIAPNGNYYVANPFMLYEITQDNNLHQLFAIDAYVTGLTVDSQGNVYSLYAGQESGILRLQIN